MKILPVFLLIIMLFFGCDKDDGPTKPDDPPVDDHEQGEVEN